MREKDGDVPIHLKNQSDVILQCLPMISSATPKLDIMNLSDSVLRWKSPLGSAMVEIAKAKWSNCFVIKLS